jgi:hypothetical protein
LGDPKSGIAHSLVLPKGKVPGPGESALVIPTFGHTLDYMDFTGLIGEGYGKGIVTPGRRTQAEVYHADPSPEPGTKLRFNLYEGSHPEEFSVRKDKSGRFILHNKTSKRVTRADLPDFKPKYREIDVDDIDPSDTSQAMMPKLDGAHVLLDLRAGRAPRVFSYRVGKKSATGLIEHTHKMPKLLEKKVPKELDGTILRGEVLGLKDGVALPAEQIGGLLNSKVWKSRAAQEALGVDLRVFPFDVVQVKGRPVGAVSFNEKLPVLRAAEKALPEVEVPPIVVDPKDKIELMNMVRAKKHPLTEEGFVLVSRDQADRYVKAKFTPDYDVFVRKVHPAKKKDGGYHDRAGAISYSWTEGGPIEGQLGGFKHDEAKDMLRNPEKYVGRVAKVKAMRVFTDKEGNPKALFQPRFKEWHLDKGDIEKVSHGSFLDELEKIARARWLKELAKAPVGSHLHTALGRYSKEPRLSSARELILEDALRRGAKSQPAREVVGRLKDLTRRAVSGRHAPKPGEKLIRAAGTAEEVATPGISDRLLFRGNPIDPSGKAALVTRHPDVASGYAAGRAKKMQQSASGELFAFEKSQLKSLGEGPADIYPRSGPQTLVGNPQAALERMERIRKFLKLPANMSAKQRAALKVRESIGASSPTYEHVIDVTKGVPNPLGRYRARLSRTPSGDPAYAIQHVEGAPVEQVFREALV